MTIPRAYDIIFLQTAKARIHGGKGWCAREERMGADAWKLFGQQAAGLGCFGLAYFLSGFLPQGANIAFAIILGIGAFIGYIVCCAKDFLDGLWLFPLLFSAASGFAVGIYFCLSDSLFFGNWRTFAIAAALSLVIALVAFPNLAGRPQLWQKIGGCIVAAGSLALSVYCFCRWGGGLAWREAAFVFLFLTFLLLGECAYLCLGGDMRHKTNLAFCAAFFIILFIVLLIVTEGDAADGIGDVFVDGGSGGTTPGKGKRERVLRKK